MIFESLSQFIEKHKRYPASWNKDDAKLFLDTVKSVNDGFKGTDCHLEEIDEKLVKIFAYVCAGECCPIQVLRVSNLFV